VIAASAVAKSPPDGYTLFLAPVTTLAIGPAIYKKLPYDTVKDFAPGRPRRLGAVRAGRQSEHRRADAAGPDRAGQSKNGQMSYGTSGASTPHHLLMEMFSPPDRRQGAARALSRQRAGADRRHLRTDPVHDGRSRRGDGRDCRGKVKVYGVTSPNRVKAMPDLPTIAEAGLPGYGATGWFSVVVAAGTPRPIIDKLNGILMLYLKKPEVQDRLNTLAITPLTSTPDELEKFIPAEIAKWAKVVKDAGIEPQ
jgi:tripartite-type tricarboxylate transporter receptor subunit TctC